MQLTAAAAYLRDNAILEDSEIRANYYSAGRGGGVPFKAITQ